MIWVWVRPQAWGWVPRYWTTGGLYFWLQLNARAYQGMGRWISWLASPEEHESSFSPAINPVGLALDLFEMQTGSRDWDMLACLCPSSLVPSQAGRKRSVVLAMMVKDLWVEAFFSCCHWWLKEGENDECLGRQQWQEVHVCVPALIFDSAWLWTWHLSLGTPLLLKLEGAPFLLAGFAEPTSLPSLSLMWCCACSSKQQFKNFSPQLTVLTEPGSGHWKHPKSRVKRASSAWVSAQHPGDYELIPGLFVYFPDRISLCSPCFLQTHSDPLASASWIPGLNMRHRVWLNSLWESSILSLVRQVSYNV